MYQLAQLNIGRFLHPSDHPVMQPFMNALASINALAESSPGFVWRLQSPAGNAVDIAHPWSEDPFMQVNMSVWESPEQLKDYVYRSSHVDFYVRRAEWFEKPAQAHYVLWWIPAGHIPSLAEAKERLDHYREHGATPHAFWFGKLFPAPTESPLRPVGN